MAEKPGKKGAAKFKASIKVKPKVKVQLSENRFLKPREATRTKKRTHLRAKQTYRLRKKEYRSLKTKDNFGGLVARKRVLEAGRNKKAAKRAYQKTKKADTTRLANQLKTTAKSSSVYHLRNKVEREAAEDDVLSEMVDVRRKSRQREQYIQSTKMLVGNAHRVNVKAGKGLYNLSDRTQNAIRGRGFQKTPEELSKTKQWFSRLKKQRNRYRRTKAYQTLQKTNNATQFFLRVIHAPLKVKSLLVIALVSFFSLIFFMFISTSLPAAIYQEELELTDSWTYMTEQDAKHSDTQNVFFTPIDDVMFYMNREFGDYNVNESPDLLHSYKQYLDELWEGLNGKAPDYKLSTMDELNTTKDSPYYMPEDDYKEMKELSQEVGYQTLSDLLEFPIETENLVITRRYGYERFGEETKLFTGIETSVNQGQQIFSPLTGVVESKTESNLIVTDGEKRTVRLTLQGVDTSRYSIGEEVSAGESIGGATGTLLRLYYEKYDSSTHEWKNVNPGFYFPKVSYAQITSLASDNFEPEKDVSERASKVYNYLTKLGYTRAGISAILGNFSVESNINPKRAEGDYLSPPVGASPDSWDDPKWLAMGGPDIYNGSYPNILHRGLGLGQWTDTSDGGNRHTLLLDFAKAKKKKWYDLELQLDFMLNGDSPGSRVMFKNVAGSKVGTTVPVLTTYFLQNWEGNPGDKLQERIQAAQSWYNFFSGSAGDMNQSSQKVYEKYKDRMKPLPTDKEMKPGQGWPGNYYALGNCTWYVYNRMAQLGHRIHGTMGNANQWVSNYHLTPGASLVSEPARGDVVIFTNGVAGSSPLYGHVAVVEVVNSDGSFVISEMNVQGEYSMSWRVLRKEAGEYFMRVR
ncbi:phage tail tip lysozyme [Lactococcus garvieae]|uniref:phage tail tip lysozyme n=1 Tax=Lactococcus garvieae TaxID=1363 RepID=UPI0038541654